MFKAIKKSSTSPPKISLSKKMSNDYEMIATCYHEASHTIMALFNLIYVDNVSISLNNGGDTYYSMCEVDEITIASLKKDLIIAELQVIYAGVIGERIYYESICGVKKLPMFLRSGSYVDTACGSEIIRRYDLSSPGKETYNLKEQIKLKLEKLLHTFWNSIKTLAHSLYKKRYLDFQDLQYLLIRSKDGFIWREKFKKMKILYSDSNDELSNKELKKIFNKIGKL